jgi:hypothetical protein
MQESENWHFSDVQASLTAPAIHPGRFESATELCDFFCVFCALTRLWGLAGRLWLTVRLAGLAVSADVDANQTAAQGFDRGGRTG